MQRILICRGRVTISLNPVTILFAAYMCLQGYWRLLLSAYISIILHEGAHAVMACTLGCPPDEIEITPLGALMRQSTQRITNGKRLLILLAGPFATFLLCAAAARCVAVGWIPYAFGKTLFICNCSILLINLLPCLPLDGGSILSLLLSRLLPESTVNKVMRFTGYAVGTVLVLCAFYCACIGIGMNLSLVFAGCLLIYAAYVATTPETLRQLQHFMERKTRLEQHGTLRMENFAVAEHTPVIQAVRALPVNRYASFMVLESGTMRQLGTLLEDELIAAMLDSPSSEVGGILQKGSEGKYTER